MLCGITKSYATNCAPDNGTVSAEYSLGQQQITNPDDNKTGFVYPTQTVEAAESSIGLNCDCSGTYSNLWLWVDSTLPSAGDGYYNIPGNKYLQIKMEVNAPSGFQTVPFGPEANKNGTYDCKNAVVKTGGDHTGSILHATFRIATPFIGTSAINNVLIASTYWNIANGTPSSRSPTATTNLYLNGTITVPQNCTINAGTQVVVDLGQLYSGDFKTIGQKPDNYTPKTFNVPIKCNDVSASANLTLRLQGTSSAGFSDALQSDNTDVGVVITDSSNNTLRPNDAASVIPFTLDSGYEANITLHAYPVSTTGNTPAEGVFTTLAYLRVDFA